MARSLAFATLMIGNVGLIVANRSWELNAVQLLARPNRAFWGVVLGALGVLATVLYVPGLNGLLHFVAPTLAQVAVPLVAGFASLLWVELVKRFGRSPAEE